MELYVATDDPGWVAESVLSGMPKPKEGEGAFYVKSDLDAVSHIFEVASGLDSLVIGEEQILQQIREAGAKARASGTAGSILSSLFVAAYNVGKRVRESLEVAQANSSVSAFALEFALGEARKAAEEDSSDRNRKDREAGCNSAQGNEDLSCLEAQGRTRVLSKCHSCDAQAAQAPGVGGRLGYFGDHDIQAT